MTLRYIVSDIHKNLKQLSDDAEITLNQVAFWVLAYADRLKSQHYAKIDSGYFLHTFPSVDVQKDSVTKIKYIELPTGVYDFDGDRGISYISYNVDLDNCNPPFTSIQFSRTTPSKSRVLYFNDDEMPTPANPYFYRANGNKVYFLGVNNVNIKKVEVGLLSTFDPTTPPDLDSEFNFPSELYPVLQRQVLDIGRFVLQIPQERINDATLDYGNSQVPKTKLISVNDQLVQQSQPQQEVSQ